MMNQQTTIPVLVLVEALPRLENKPQAYRQVHNHKLLFVSQDWKDWEEQANIKPRMQLIMQQLHEMERFVIGRPVCFATPLENA
jgi:hypothetical protein